MLEEDVMSMVLMVGYVALIVVSYKLAVFVLEKSGLLE